MAVADFDFASLMGVEVSFGPPSGPALMLLDASDSPLLGVGEGSRLWGAPSDFREATGLEVVLCDM